MALTKIGPKFQVTIPKAARTATGLKVGDIVEATATPRGILLKPKLVVDRDPELEKQLEASEADVKAGRVLGPFDSAQDVAKAIKSFKASKRRSHARRAQRKLR